MSCVELEHARTYPDLRINIERLLAATQPSCLILDRIEGTTAGSSHGWHSPTLTKAGRDLVVDLDGTSSGLDVTVDGIGNVVGVWRPE